MNQKLKQLIINLSLSLFSLLLIPLLLEGGIRLLGGRPQPDRVRLHSQLGWVWTPGYDEIEIYKGTAYRMKVSTQGLRDNLVTVPKPADTYRVLVLGGFGGRRARG